MSKSGSSPALLRLIRPEQWIKNLLLFLPVFFAQKINDLDLIIPLLFGFASFCFAASTIYIFNDYCDRESDRLHPDKADRPLASGAVTSGRALVLGGVILLLSVLLALLTNNTIFLLLVAGYIALNILYSLFFKKIPILDLAVLGIGFLLRIFSGGTLADVPISEWLVIMTFLGALMIGLGKRRDEFILSEKTQTHTRSSLSGYNLKYIDIAMIFVASITTVAYLMYTISPEVTERIGNNYVYLTSFFVVLGMLKYLQLTFVYGKTGKPTRLFLENRSLQFIILIWLISFGVLLYWI